MADFAFSEMRAHLFAYPNQLNRLPVNKRTGRETFIDQHDVHSLRNGI